MAGRAPPPLSNSISRNPRRVSFRIHDIEGGPRRRGACATCCNICCAWASFLIWTFVILLLIAMVALFAFFQSTLPQVKVQRIDIYRLNVTDPSKSKDKESRLSVDLEVLVNVTNRNEKIELEFGPMNVETTVEAFTLEKMHVSGFKMAPESTKDLKIRPPGMWSKAVNEDDAKELKANSDQHEMVFSVKMTGTIKFWYERRMMSKLLLNILCQDIEQSEVDKALAPKCVVKLSPFR